MKISELREGTRNVEIEGTVTRVDEPRSVVTRYGATSVTNATIEDDTGTVLLVLWGDQAKSAKEGATAVVSNGYVTSWKNNLQLNVGKQGKLEFK